MESYPKFVAPMENHYAQAYEKFMHLVGNLSDQGSQRLTHGEVETLIHAEGMELLRRLTQGHLDQRNEQEPLRERVLGEDGIARTHRREGCERRLETRFGEVMVRRRGYGARGLANVYPLDAELNLPADKYSHGLREQICEEVISGSFDEAVAHLDRLGG